VTAYYTSITTPKRNTRKCRHTNHRLRVIAVNGLGSKMGKIFAYRCWVGVIRSVLISKNTTFRAVTPCSLAEVRQRFLGPYRTAIFHRVIENTRMKPALLEWERALISFMRLLLKSKWSISQIKSSTRSYKAVFLQLPFLGNHAPRNAGWTHKQKNSMVWVRERTIPTERPPLVGEVIANFCG
jgi:hypothetical protein